MRLDEPSWWYSANSRGIAARALAPVAALYGWAAMRRFNARETYRSRLPVICVGNFTAGGTGKTPMALHICEELKADGAFPVFLTRGFSGKETGPVWVDLDRHTAEDVGDEPLLLARAAPTLVALDRAEGAKFIESGGRQANVIIMDDGMQNSQLAKDLTIAIVDARRGVGNGAVIPAGPLRAPFEFQLSLADAIVVNKGATSARDANAYAEADKTGARRHPCARDLAKQFRGTILEAGVVPRADGGWLQQTPTIAFAGIANPERFFRMLVGCGAQLIEEKVFPDHHGFSEADAKALLDAAFDSGARLVTTEKDLVRLSGYGGHRAELRAAAVAMPIQLAFSPGDDIIIDDLLKALPGRAAAP